MENQVSNDYLMIKITHDELVELMGGENTDINLKPNPAIILISGLLSCEEVIDIDVQQSPPQLVIDALLTDEDTIHTVRISSTSDVW